LQRLQNSPRRNNSKHNDEVEFYEAFFLSVSVWVEECDRIVKEGKIASSQFGLGALDALHIAAAKLAKADEFITAERATSPFSRVTDLKVVTIGR